MVYCSMGVMYISSLMMFIPIMMYSGKYIIKKFKSTGDDDIEIIKDKNEIE